MTPEFAHSKLPNDIVENYPGFAKFIESYYIWCQTDGFNSVINNYRALINQQAYSKDYEYRIVKNLGVDISIIENTNVKTELLYKLLNEFLETRGTITSFETLFRMMFNRQVEISFPRDTLFKTSESTYLRTSVMIIEGLYPLNIESSIRGLRSGTTSGIESFIPFYINNIRYYIVECNNVYDEYIIGEALEITTLDYVYNSTHVPVIGLDIISAGTEYKKGDVITPSSNKFDGYFVVESVSKGPIENVIINSPGTGYKVGEKILTDVKSHFDAFISSVNSEGAVTGILIRNKGYNFESAPSFKVIGSLGTGLSITFSGTKIGAVTKIVPYKGSIIFDTKNITYTASSVNGNGLIVKSKAIPNYNREMHIDKRGFLGYNSCVIDSYTKHSHSYNIVSDVPGTKYETAVTKYANQSGYVYNKIYSVVNKLKTDQIGVTGEFIRE